MNKPKMFQCPYTDISCSEIDTAGMTKTKPCDECDNYNNGVRPTGATPVFSALVDKIAEIKKLWVS